MILDIVCGLKQTVIVTRKSGIWVTEVASKKPTKEAEPEGTKKKSKDEEKKEKANLRWINIAPLCQKIK
jgi:hypothetical protein